MDWKISLKELLPRRRKSPGAYRPGLAADSAPDARCGADFYKLEFAPAQGQRRTRPILPCERHTSRSLLALGNCSRYCVTSCILADALQDMEELES